jgi:hypothetical protein
MSFNNSNHHQNPAIPTLSQKLRAQTKTNKMNNSNQPTQTNRSNTNEPKTRVLTVRSGPNHKSKNLDKKLRTTAALSCEEKLSKSEKSEASLKKWRIALIIISLVFFFLALGLAYGLYKANQNRDLALEMQGQDDTEMDQF